MPDPLGPRMPTRSPGAIGQRHIVYDERRTGSIGERDTVGVAASDCCHDCRRRLRAFKLADRRLKALRTEDVRTRVSAWQPDRKATLAVDDVDRRAEKRAVGDRQCDDSPRSPHGSTTPRRRELVEHLAAQRRPSQLSSRNSARAVTMIASAPDGGPLVEQRGRWRIRTSGLDGGTGTMRRALTLPPRRDARRTGCRRR